MHLSAEVFAALVAVAAVAGFIDAIAGGGGLLTLPALLAAGLPPVTAIATSKLQSSLGTSTAVAAFARRGLIDLGRMWPAALAALVGGAAGAVTLEHLDPTFLKAFVPILLIAISIYFLLSPKLSDHDRPHRIGPRHYALIAFPLAFYDGFFGPGTGAFFVLTLTLLVGFALVKATANTKLLNLCSNLGALAVLAAGGHILWPLGLGMAASAMIGGQLGAMTAMKVGSRLIRPLLVIISLALTAKLLLQPDNPLAKLIWRS
jgi:uncharacterized membrane protein YfcA